MWMCVEAWFCQIRLFVQVVVVLKYMVNHNACKCAETSQSAIALNYMQGKPIGAKLFQYQIILFKHQFTNKGTMSWYTNKKMYSKFYKHGYAIS